MTRLRPLYLLSLIAALSLNIACNKDDETYYYSEASYTNCGLTSFSINANNKILAGLDSVYFSIDLITAQVFNADSLPPETDVTRLVPSISAQAARTIELTFKSRFTGNDTTVNFTENPKDSINFSSPVKLTVTAYNSNTKRDYTVKVNVHTVKSDTLVWDNDPVVSLPADFTAQRSVKIGDRLITLGHNASGDWSLITTTGIPGETAPSVEPATVPASADLSSFSATGQALYIADTDGTLYTSTDFGTSWASSGATMHCVYGGYGDTLLGSRRDNDGWHQVTWPAAADEPLLPSGCPVSGTSQLITYESKWTSAPMAIMIGGRDASGHLSGDAWAYDGSAWNRVSTLGIDERTGVTLLPYFTPYTTGAWRVDEQSVLLAMGGTYEGENGTEVSNTVYISRDMGITWAKGSTYLQFPESFPGFYDAQAFVIDSRLSVDSRISRPITSWECPYIYLYGGLKADGSLLTDVSRGVINRFTFKPLQ